ncbi:MAG: hypothetical protein DWQ44_12365 [Bacteroidetes bacterium]|nr:MAG: hypothetical protein DWQ33_07645 [Bacteroidota bacterium]REK08071.1 MAG: hypothetical protein DWQ39_00510 [Bacteroidota bacterium]REK32276.1 MAG: hypothetical protein DWQ44_12365 [Bacteroidota bacterium]REK47428.1 MAG: hypothetical protein DWQ48_12935 [Bacteroidota bacterium]
MKTSARQYIKSIFILLLISGVYSSCKKDSQIINSNSFNYFPTAKGTWVEYNVDSIYHGENDNNNDDSVYTFNFQIREIVDSTFLDGEGREVQVLIRYKRMNSSDEWRLVSVWTQRLSLTGAYRTEDNITYQKLAFPINSRISWDGNAANILSEELYSYESFHEENLVGSFSFDSTLTVLQVDEDNFVERIFGKEIYAVGVGMIFKQRDDLGKRNGLVVKGLEYKMTLRDYGPR